MSDKEFVEAEGLTHLVHGEFTLCGDAFDLATDETGYAWATAKRNVVTCPRCADIINLTRRVRVEI